MSKNITIAGASYTDVPTITVPDTAGGLAKFVDVSDTTATIEDVRLGKKFHTADGDLIVGTNAGGGGAGDCLTEESAVLNDSAFSGTGLTLLSIPPNISSISSDAITKIADRAGEIVSSSSNLDKLTSLMLGHVTEVGSRALYGRNKLKIAFMYDLIAVKDRAFAYCQNLVPYMPNLRTAGDYAFTSICLQSDHDVTLDFSSLETGGMSCFANSFQAPGSVIRFPKLKNISHNFLWDTRAANVEIGDAVTNVYYSAIRMKETNSMLVLHTKVPPAVNMSGRKIVYFSSTGHIYVPDDSLEAYKTADGWNLNADDFLPLSAYPG